MARLEPNDVFLEYEKMIVSNPNYYGMPDLYNENKEIQWEAPSNRPSGKHRDTHDKRLAWWRHKAAEIGISTDEDKWISKTAKAIHPTKRKPCKVCGRVMDIRYCYLNAHFINAVRKLPYVTDDLEMDECTHIVDFVTEFYELYGMRGISDLRSILRCKSAPNIPDFNNLEECIEWLRSEYIPSEPSKLSPGAMSNAPDRLDGFHTYNRCCRHKADKGRSKDNLASYSTDRRAFEYWVDGNWVTANKTMGLFKTDDRLKNLKCLREGDGGNHPTPCDADHIGPISLGFCHRPVFQPLCSSCNSSKNNRMFYSDVEKLIQAERQGQTVITWYAKTAWDLCKHNVHSNEDAIKLSKILRDNRHNAMLLYGKLFDSGCLIFLASYLNLSYADFTYSNPSITIDSDRTVSATFQSKPSILKYSMIQKARRFRVAFQALDSYCEKENRNGLFVSFDGQEDLIQQILQCANAFDLKFSRLHEALTVEGCSGFNDEEILKPIVTQLPSDDIYKTDIDCVQGHLLMKKYMDSVGEILASKWGSLRYVRDNY